MKNTMKMRIFRDDSITIIKNLKAAGFKQTRFFVEKRVFYERIPEAKRKNKELLFCIHSVEMEGTERVNGFIFDPETGSDDSSFLGIVLPSWSISKEITNLIGLPERLKMKVERTEYSLENSLAVMVDIEGCDDIFFELCDVKQNDLESIAGRVNYKIEKRSYFDIIDGRNEKNEPG